MLGEITALPYPDRSFNLVCAFDIVEHVEDDQQVFRELSRVAKDDATVIFSVPLIQRAGAPSTPLWGTFDATIPQISWPSWKSIVSCLSRARASACNLGAAGSWILPSGV